jgi:glutathione S-transferase
MARDCIPGPALLRIAQMRHRTDPRRTEAKTMKIYGSKASTCTRKVLTTLAEKGATAELVAIDMRAGEHKGEAHLARQPFGKVPALEDDGFMMYESRAIMRYLDARLPGPKLTPADPRGLARMEQWISVEHEYFSPRAMKIVHQLYFGPMRGNAPDLKVVETARAELQLPLDVAARALEKQPYFAGDAFTLADVTWMPYLEYLVAAKQGDLVSARPAIARWWESVSGRPSWKQVTAK